MTHTNQKGLFAAIQITRLNRTRLAGCAAVLGAFLVAAQSVFGEAAIPWADNQANEYRIDGFSVADAVAVDAAHGKLYATDRTRHRVLRFAYPLTNNLNATNAEAVFGQADMFGTSANRGGSVGPYTLNNPYGIAVAPSGDLWVSDMGNNRVLKYSSAWYATSGAAAIVVLGQSNFTDSGSGTDASHFSSPSGLAIDAADNLWVSESGNMRVMRFANSSAISSPGASASVVLGQTSFTATGSGTAQNRFGNVYGVAVSGTTLWVADGGNNRVLRFDNAAAKGIGANADGVLGQSSYTAGSPNRGISMAANSMSFPGGVAADAAGTLYVADSFNSRILIFANAALKANGSAADQYLGATGFTSSGNLGSVWNMFYDPTYHRLVAGNIGSSSLYQYFNCYTTATTLSSSPNPSTTTGGAVTFTATVTTDNGGPMATGYVSFKDGATTLGSGALDASGIATFTTTSLADGNHIITAVFTNTSTHKGSTSASLTQVVGKYTPTTSLTSTPNPSTAGASVEFSATVTSSGGVPDPTGTVSFYSDDVLISTATLSAGSAKATTSSLSEGSHVIKSIYNGDTNFRQATNTITQTVNPSGIFAPVANVEKDFYSGSTQVYNGTAWGGILYIGNFVDGASGFSAFKFDLRSLSGTISSAKIRVCVSQKDPSGTNFNINLFGSSDDAWTDAPSPATTAPLSSNSPAIATFNTTSLSLGVWVTNDVTTFVKSQYSGDKIVSFIYSADLPPFVPADNYIAFYSREDSTRHPVLEVQMVTITDQAALVFNPATPQAYATVNNLSVSGGSGTGAVSYSVLSGPGQIMNGSQLAITAPSGTVTVVATKAGDSSYYPISVTNTVIAVPANQAALSFAPSTPQAYNTTNTLSATGGSGAGATSYAVLSGPGVIVNGNKLVITAGSGTVTVAATKAGDGNYVAISATNTVLASLAPQATLTFNPATPQAYDTTNTLSATGGSGFGAISYAVLSGPGTVVNGNKLAITAGSGTVTVAATKASDGDYAAISATNTVLASLAPQAALTFNPATPQAYDTTNTLSATGGSSSGAISYAVLSGPGTIVNGNKLVITAGSGIVTVVATKAGDSSYYPISVTNTVIAAPANQAALSFAPVTPQAYDTTNTLSATGGSGAGAISYAVLSGPGIIVNGNKLVITAGSGTVTVAATKGADGNYFAISATNTVSASLAPQAELSFNPIAPQVYGTTNTLSATGGSGTGALSYLVLDGPGSIVNVTQLVATAGFGLIEVVATRASDGNYRSVSATNTVFLFPKVLTVTGAVASSKPYDGKITATVDYAAAQLVGVIGSDSVSLDTNTASASFADKNAGDGKTVNVTGLALTGVHLTNYSLIDPTLSANISKVGLGIQANNQSRAYGATNPGFTFTFSGFVDGDNSSSLTSQPSATCSATPTSGIGKYNIVPSGGSSPNYTLSYTNGDLTVTQAVLQITVNNSSRFYGSPDPTFTGTITGIKNSDPITATYSTSASATSGVATYPIIPILADPSNKLGNYSVTTNNGTLTVDPRNLTGKIVDATRVYGETNPLFQVVYSGYVNGETNSVLSGTVEFSCMDSNSVPVTTNTVVGLYPIQISAAQTAANYSISYFDGELTITPAVLTVLAQDASRAYGQSNPDFTFDVTGFANREGTDVLSGKPALSTAATPASPTGSYEIVADVGTLTATNYTFVTTNATLRITQGTLVVTADNTNRLYGQGNPTFTGTLSGLQNGDAIDATYASDTTATNAVGTYDILPTLVDPSNLATNYTVKLNKGTLTIDKTPLSVVADNTSRFYGQNNPVFTGVITGLRNSDPITATYASAADAASPVSTYDIVPTPLDPENKLGNYDLRITNGVLTVNRAGLTVSADNTNRVYGAANPVFTGNIAGIQNGDAVTAAYACAATAVTGVGNYPIIPALSDPDGKLANYSVTTNVGTLTITTAPLVAVADDASRLYGASNPTFTGTVNGVVNSDGITATYSTLAGPASPVGPYAIMPSWVDPKNKLANYSPSVTNGTLTVSAAPLRGSLWSFSRAYGETNPVFGVTYSGYVNGESDSILTGTFVASCVDTNANPVDTNSMVDVYPITVATAQGAPNYDVSYVNGSLTVTQAVLLVSADPNSRPYGQTNPVFTATITGFVNGEDTNVVSGQADLSTPATISSPVGDYEIIAALGTLYATNYSFIFSNSTLTVGKAMLTVTADPKTRTYGADNPTLTASITGFVDGDTSAVLSGEPVLTTKANTNSTVGSYTISAALGTLTAANYLISVKNGTLDVTPAPLTITADDQTTVYGSANPPLSISYSGFVRGEGVDQLLSIPTVSMTVSNGSSAGKYTITLSGGDSTNYAVTRVNGTLTITPAPLTATAENQSRPYGASNPGLSIIYSGFVNGDHASKLQFRPVGTMAASPSSHVGVYPITLSGGKDRNYTITLVNGTLTVTQAALTATAEAKTRVYGASNPELTIAYTGFVNNDDPSVLDTPVAISTPATAASRVGSYPITLSGGTATDYALTRVDGTLTITAAPLSVVAANASRPYGVANPSFTGTLSGLQSGDSITATFASSAATDSPAGQYPIVPTLVDPSSRGSNYTVSLTNGTLTVTAALQLTATPGTTVVGELASFDAAGKVADGGSLNFGGATLTIRAVANASSQDRLSINPLAGSPVSITESTVAFDDVVIGTFSGGDGTSPLVIVFNSNATSVELTALIQALAFKTTDESAKPREFELALVYGDTTVTGSRTILLNRVPVAKNDTFLIQQGTAVTFPFDALIANDTDPDNDPLSFESVSLTTSAGGTMTVSSTNVLYTPPTPAVAEDTFTYKVSDGRGGSATGLVALSCVKPRNLEVRIDNEQSAVLRMGGTPLVTYRVDASEDLVSWEPLGFVTATAYGAIEISDITAKNQPHRFYRAVAQ